MSLSVVIIGQNTIGLAGLYVIYDREIFLSHLSNLTSALYQVFTNMCWGMLLISNNPLKWLHLKSYCLKYFRYFSHSPADIVFQ